MSISLFFNPLLSNPIRIFLITDKENGRGIKNKYREGELNES